MNKKLIAILTSMLLLIVACGSKKQSASLSIDQARFERVSILKNYTGNITSASFINDSLFVIANKQGKLNIYNIEGHLIREIKAVGTGPLEYIEPNIIKTSNNKIYLWDNQLLKIVVFKHTGEPVEEYTNFNRAINDFVVLNGLIYTYLTGGDNEYLIQSINPISGEIKGHYLKSNNESNLLNINPTAGGLAVKDNQIFAIKSADLKVINISNEQETEFKTIDDNSFKVEKLNESATKLFNSNSHEAIDFLMQNSFTKGLYSFKDHLIVISEIGYYESNNEIFNTSNRFNSVYKIDSQSKRVEKSILPIELTLGDNSIFQNSKNLFLIKYEIIEEQEELVLYKLS